jgi:hypothetical protein
MLRARWRDIPGLYSPPTVTVPAMKTGGRPVCSARAVRASLALSFRVSMFNRSCDILGIRILGDAQGTATRSLANTSERCPDFSILKLLTTHQATFDHTIHMLLPSGGRDTTIERVPLLFHCARRKLCGETCWRYSYSVCYSPKLSLLLAIRHAGSGQQAALNFEECCWSCEDRLISPSGCQISKQWILMVRYSRHKDSEITHNKQRQLRRGKTN